MNGLDEKDLAQLRERGISGKDAYQQLEFFRTPPRPAKLERPCNLGDGIHSLTSADIAHYAAIFEKGRAEGRVAKFVPASGAGTRMLGPLLKFAEDPAALNERALSARAAADPDARQTLEWLRRLGEFPFYDELEAEARKRGVDLRARLAGGDYAEAAALVLDCVARPKGLLPCHRYPGGARTPLEEHLLEAAAYAKDADGSCRVHFTVPAAHLEDFRRAAAEIAARRGKELKVTFDVSFSVQKSSTDTLAADAEGRPVRREDGGLLLRPGGHGALIENLNDLRGDVVFVKNIDNVAVEPRLEEAVLWKKALGGLLIELQSEIFRCISWLAERPEDEGVIDQAFRLLLRRLSIAAPPSLKKAPPSERYRFLMGRLNRPLRVCGTVENAGEPGGGPFWVKGKFGEETVQIVEQAQADPAQRALFQEATHFNPVDIVCALRDLNGKPFDLRRFTDPQAVFLSRKTENGRDIRALERPGLWNGGMAEWNTVFVEVPASTFNPIKTLGDLLRDGHRVRPAAPPVKAPAPAVRESRPAPAAKAPARPKPRRPAPAKKRAKR